MIFNFNHADTLAVFSYLINYIGEEVYILNLPRTNSHQPYRSMDELLAVQPESKHQAFHEITDLLNLEVEFLYLDIPSLPI